MMLYLFMRSVYAMGQIALITESGNSARRLMDDEIETRV